MPTIHKYKEIFKVVLVYAIFGSGWIFFSDTLLNWLVRDPDIITQISIYKGLFFIIITSLLLFYLVARLSNKIRQSADALKESEERNRLLSDLTMEGIVIHKNGIAKHVNSSMAKMLGYEYGELLNKNFLEFIHDEDQNVVQQNIVKDYAEPYTIRVQRKGGQYFFAEIEARNFQARNDTWRVTAVRDITKRRWAEKKLTESHELLENLARLVPGVIYQYRLYPDGTSAFPYSSPGIFDIYGVTPKEVKEDATPVFGRLHPDDRERVTRTILESAETLNTFYCEFKVILPETGLGWRWSQAHPQKLEDGSILWHGIILDITERKNAEKAAEKLNEQLVQAQKMESVGRLAGGVAHDFNNMLGVILGYTEMALEQVDTEQPIFSALEEIQHAAERSSDLTRQLLAFARKQTISPKVLDLNSIVGSMMKMLQRLIGENIELKWFPGDNLGQIRMDPSQIDQVLANLCINARDSITDMGKVIIETTNVHLDQSIRNTHAYGVPGDFILLTVSDNGSGMEKETLAHLFEPFYTTKKTGEGTGLGLATVYGIVKQNKGLINVYSELGYGTTFKIYLPRYFSKTGKVSDSVVSHQILPGHETILLVEDEPMILGMTTLMLQRLGYNVLPASTPGEAISLANEQPGEISLLITDVVMPEMNGRELSTKLNSLRPNLKCLFMSGYTANVIAHHGVIDENVHFIQKPFSKKELAAILREILA